VAAFVCGVSEKNPNHLSACENLPEYRDTGYCVLHFPGEEKKEDFEQVKKDKWTCVGSVDCLRLRTVRGKESSAENQPDLPAGVSPRSYPAG
jgi:hypothetical protein